VDDDEDDSPELELLLDSPELELLAPELLPDDEALLAAGGESLEQAKGVRARRPVKTTKRCIRHTSL
jgi:hypothetical protein